MASLFGKTRKPADLEMRGGNSKFARRNMDDPDTKFPSTTKQKFPRGQRKALGFIISGIMSVNAERKMTLISLRCCAIFNLLSAVTSLAAFLLFTIDLRRWVPRVRCDSPEKCTPGDYQYSVLSESHFSLRIILLVFALMELSISTAVSVIGWNKVWDCSIKGEDLPENSLNRHNSYESLVAKDAVYTSMRAIKPLEVPALNK
ncbi:membrane-spanning 4-domains, subfamily A, member 17A.11 [Hemitrygon akajei]|uniref:membrane-spanning 4-domains, subfamily A, member 17A.11 n=1 Tax=Hemitrygon akajei TaxID=2704970 RepID=UPI003BFA11C2